MVDPSLDGRRRVHKPPAAGCMWNFDPEGEASPNGFINGDSLQGWWAIDLSRRFMVNTFTFYFDVQQPWGCLDFGNTILKVHNATRPWVALTEGWNIGSLGSPFFTDTRRRAHYVAYVLQRVFTGMCSPALTDVPSAGEALSDFVNIGNNPLASGLTRIRFGMRKPDLVTVRIFDIAGREVRLLTHRKFAAGEHDLQWDGTDGRGQPVARGVYFTQVGYEDAGYKEARKITVLK